MNLGCAEFAVPGKTLKDKLGTLESRGMWLELVNDGKKQLRDVLDVQQSFDTSIESVQAYMLHKLQMLSAEEKERKVALRHVEETIKLASGVGAKNVVTTIAYGEPTIENPRENASNCSNISASSARSLMLWSQSNRWAGIELLFYQACLESIDWFRMWARPMCV